MRRFVPALHRKPKFLWACAATAFLSFSSGTTSQELQFTLPQARETAVRAGLAGHPGIAEYLAVRLLQHDPEDADALLAMATVELARGNWRSSYKTARQAFRFADTKDIKFHAARVTAVAAMAEERYVPTQFWLRRAGDLAATDVQRNQVERNFQLVRAKSRLHYRFDFSASPSSNVNGGSDTPYNIIDGVPIVGRLSPSAQALSGFIAQTNVNLSYRLNKTDRSLTSLTAGFYAKEVELSSESKAKAPGFSADDLASSSLRAGLRHVIALGKPGTAITFGGEARQNWQGRQRTYFALKGSVGYRQPIGKHLNFSGQFSTENRSYETGNDGQFNSASLGLTYSFENGSKLNGTVFFSETTNPTPFFNNTSTFAKITYSFGQPIKSVNLSAGIGAGITDYSNYTRIGFIPVAGGRQDEALFLDLDATFTGIEYAGFSPSIRIRRQWTDSNVSRFDTNEWAISAGIQSNF